MKKITVYLTSGQTITFDGLYKMVQDPLTSKWRHKFSVSEQSGFELPFLPHDMVAAVTTQEERTAHDTDMDPEAEESSPTGPR
jgi:hypothetical protein